jgi:predicted AlkP superfamily phosphohydrolase/phosphomutase
MRYLRMLSNSLAVALFATCFVLTIVLQLNPTLPLHPVRLAPVLGAVGVFYALNFTAIVYIVLVVRHMFAHDVFSPAWLSVGVLTWMAAAVTLAAAALTWTNLQAFELVLDSDTVRRTANGMLTLVMSAALFAFVALLRAHLGPPGRKVCGSLLVLVWVGSIAAPLVLRGRGAEFPLDVHPGDAVAGVDAAERATRVSIIAIDGGSLDFITSATAEGRLPNFGRILDGGAALHLATLRPTSAEAVWAAVSTGKLPQKNGVRSAGRYRLPGGGDPILLLPVNCFSSSLVRFGFLAEEPYTAASLRARTIWNILGALGIPVGVVGWPLTYPAPPIRGYLISDVYQRLIAARSEADDPSAVYPPEVNAEAFRAVESAAAHGGPVLPTSGLDARYQVPARTDDAYDRIARELARTRPTQITMVRFQSLDAIGHYFLRYAMPTEFGDVTDEEKRRFGAVLEQHYGLIDDAIGRAMASLDADDLLLVVSGYGMEPMGIVKRLLEKALGDPDLSGTHEAAPDGFLMAFGGPVARARLAARGSVVDVVPTVLYFLGLPIGRDMDGHARTDLFLPTFVRSRPMTFIPTYDR